MIEKQNIKQISDYTWEIPKSFRADMRVPARFYTSKEMLPQIMKDRSLDQLVNVATLPGVERYALAMPDMHEGYGFPIGGVAAIRVKDGVISPGGVGYDINCGVRLLKADFNLEDIKDHLVDLVNQMQRDVPSGVGRGGDLKFSGNELDDLLKKGAGYLIEEGYGLEKDLEQLEENGQYKIADPNMVSDRAKKRGKDQCGTLGAGNHFLEIQRVDQVFDNRFGLEKDQIVVMIHTGSRGLGHQICTDYVRLMDQAMAKYGIKLPDRELACAPFDSKEGQNYLKAMAAGANFAWANRQMITHLVRGAFAHVFKLKNLKLDSNLKTVYDVAHNIAKIEKHEGKEFCVHRKGATRSFPGQPVIIPGSMGTASYVLVGTETAMQETFGSTCHGAGRAMSRKKAKQQVTGQQIKQELEAQGIVVRGGSAAGLAEEAPIAYKDVEQVVEVVDMAKIATKVARLKPLAVVKG